MFSEARHSKAQSEVQGGRYDRSGGQSVDRDLEEKMHGMALKEGARNVVATIGHLEVEVVEDEDRYQNRYSK